MLEDNSVLLIFHFTYVMTVGSIVLGSLAERTQTLGYLIFGIVLNAFIYPVIVAWTWGNGWLA